MVRPKASRQRAMKASASRGGDPGLVRLLAGIDLHQKPRRAALPGDLGREPFRQPFAVHRLDDVEEGDGVGRLVRLQAARSGGVRSPPGARATAPSPPAPGSRRRPAGRRRAPAPPPATAAAWTPPSGSPRQADAPTRARRPRSAPGWTEAVRRRRWSLSADPVETMWRAARRLGGGGGLLPPLFFFTDPARTPSPREVIERLPRGAGVVFRGFGRRELDSLAAELRRLARRRGLPFLVGGDARLARALGADGLHLPQARVPARFNRSAWPKGFILTAAAHSPAAIRRAERAGVDAVVVSAIFSSGSPSAGAAARDDEAGGVVPLHGLRRLCPGRGERRDRSPARGDRDRRRRGDRRPAAAAGQNLKVVSSRTRGAGICGSVTRWVLSSWSGARLTAPPMWRRGVMR